MFRIRVVSRQKSSATRPISCPATSFSTRRERNPGLSLLQMLSKDKDTFGNELNAVVDVCTGVFLLIKIFGEFLHKKYGGPRTLLVEPFIDMLVVLKEKKLPAAPLAAPATLLWAQNNVDHDWEVWNSKPPN
ncbi:hypothetical protein RJ641_012643 [Dillenia turbinata]|uniref:Uncharacterized protein n=1 Tax=Dillenia turbinata TaxID=194707 RepID=A0AAN8V2I8_9MAGN